MKIDNCDNWMVYFQAEIFPEKYTQSQLAKYLLCQLPNDKWEVKKSQSLGKLETLIS